MSFIRDLITGFDQSSDLNKEAAAHLDALEDLANAKADLFEEKIKTSLVNAGTGTDRTIPITMIQDFTRQTRAYLSSDANKISGAVNDAIAGFVQGGKENVVSGVGKLITTAVTALFGESEGNESTTYKYYVANEGIALVRIDFMAWKRAVKSTSLTTKVEQVSAFVLSKATVDIQKTDFDTFLDLYQQILTADDPSAKPQDIIKDAHELFDAFKAKVMLARS